MSALGAQGALLKNLFRRYPLPLGRLQVLRQFELAHFVPVKCCNTVACCCNHALNLVVFACGDG